jgi:hypothetical protein
METRIMAESHPPQRDAAAQRRRRARITRRFIGAIYLAFALFGVIFALVTWWIGKINPINALVFVLVIASATPIGLLAWQGDYVGTSRMDEGQREMDRAAQSDAFYIAYLGLYVLFFGAIFFPAFSDAMPVAIGVLLLLVSLTWLGGYMVRRWRP